MLRRPFSALTGIGLQVDAGNVVFLNVLSAVFKGQEAVVVGVMVIITLSADHVVFQQHVASSLAAEEVRSGDRRFLRPQRLVP